ncbi:MAG: bifunctional hydroxymethylpyrimidine kinase/phosphomethylpyrimidine kinase, partial [Candidatus Omnitrophica bacterium]|nr:bifunctional hydroxymethylpyrimidine kinase/phosphomethylpyrimidine kinase [Candidatus Omnitrophota bacterium]
VYACGVVGQDTTGAMLIDELRERGINAEGIIVDSERPTIKKTRIIAHHQQVVRVDSEADIPIKRRLLDKLTNFIEEKIKDIDAVIIEDYGKGLIQPHLIKRIVSMGKKYKKIIAVDPKEEHFSYYKGVTVVTPNQHEAEIAASIKIKDEPSVQKAAKRLMDKLKCKAVLITLGEKGMALLEEGGKFNRVPTVAREVFDVSGAGDTAIATLTLAKVAGATMQEAAYISNAAAGIVVGKLGVAVVDPDELKKAIKFLQKNK